MNPVFWPKNVHLVGAVIFLVAANIALILIDPIKNIDADSLPAIRSWVWWATNDYRHQDRAPDIVLLGSSVMMHPTWWQEAAYRKKDVDLVVDHRSHYLEDMISSRSGLSNLHCFNFALPGCMASDDCIIARSQFIGDHRPKMVVIGTCPRDFVDNHFTHAASSRHYRYLSHFTDSDKLVDLAMPEWWQRIDYWTNSLNYFKGRAQQIQLVLTHDVSGAVAPILNSLPQSPLEHVSEEDRKFAMHRSEIQKGVFVAHPTSPYNYVDIVEDCLSRYRTANDPVYNNQRQWFELCLKTLKERDIETLVVNMPVTSTAQRCMRSGVYDRHVRTLKTLAERYDFEFLDANQEYQKEASPYDFTDWAHMNAAGGKKLHEIIGRFITSDKKLMACLSTGGTGSIAAKDGVRSVAAKETGPVAARDGTQSAAANAGTQSGAARHEAQPAAANTGARSVAAKNTQTIVTKNGTQSGAARDEAQPAATNTGTQSVAARDGRPL